ncbi:hypothetical protein OT109_01570 [Phycisphaeraceae bacterium D3-23]
MDSERAFMVDPTGVVTDRAFSHGRPVVSASALEDGTVVLAGNIAERGENGRFDQAALWGYAPDGSLQFQHLARPQDGYNRLITTVHGEGGWVYALQSVLPEVNAVTGLPSRNNYDGRARIVLVAYAPGGHESYRTTIDEVVPDLAVEIEREAPSAFFFDPAIGLGPSGLWVAWTHVEITSRTESGRIKDGRVTVRARLLTPNPRGTTILYDEE